MDPLQQVQVLGAVRDGQPMSLQASTHLACEGLTARGAGRWGQLVVTPSEDGKQAAIGFFKYSNMGQAEAGDTWLLGSGIGQVPPGCMSLVAYDPGNQGTRTALVVTSSGSVGIGCDAPQQTLDVAGSINVSGEVMQNGVAIAPQAGAWESFHMAVVPGTPFAMPLPAAVYTTSSQTAGGAAMMDDSGTLEIPRTGVWSLQMTTVAASYVSGACYRSWFSAKSNRYSTGMRLGFHSATGAPGLAFGSTFTGVFDSGDEITVQVWLSSGSNTFYEGSYLGVCMLLPFA